MEAHSPEFRKKKIAHNIMNIIKSEGFDAMLCGGCVRDQLLGIKPKDFDIATTSLPQQNLAMFKTDGFRSIATGLEHGTITVVYKNHSFELTTLREDTGTDGRKATVTFGDSFEKDSIRRDFTINAMYEDENGKIFDFHDGKRHLVERRIVFVGDTQTRIREDYLRILRYFRFSSRLNLQRNREDFEHLKKLSHLIKELSRERVHKEFKELFTTIKHEKLLLELIDSHVLNHSLSLIQNLTIKDCIKIYNSWSEYMIKIPHIHIFKMFLFFLDNDMTKQQSCLAIGDLKASRLEISLMGWLYEAYESDDSLSQASMFKLLNDFERITGKEYQNKFTVHLFSEFGSSPGLEVFKSLSNLEQLKNKLRTSKPFIDGNQIASILPNVEGKKLGEIIKELRELQLNEKITSKEQAIDWLAQKKTS